MPDDTQSSTRKNPPVDYAVAVWLGTPEHEIERGLREGWIRGPALAPRASLDDVLDTRRDVVPEPPAPGETSTPLPAEAVFDTRSRIEAVMRALDDTLSEEAFERAWNEAGADDEARGTRLMQFLHATLGIVPQQPVLAVEALEAVERAAADANGSARFLRLSEHSASDLAALAGGSALVRRALAEHSPWAFADDPALADRADPQGRFDRFDPDSGEVLLSDAWIGDRAKHAAWRAAAASGASLEIADAGWRFVDRAAGDEATIELIGDSDGPVHQVVFATDEGDRIDGADGTDRLHGGRGDDVLRGRGGVDLLEGGDGDDLLIGGAGDDRLLGQQGRDELEGGAGDDLLEGGAGDDELAGGAGSDRLEGGSGEDVYRIETGGGEDAIVDDGGTILIDDVVVGGTMRHDGDAWLSADGRLRFALEDGGSTLVIRDASSAASGVPGAVRILQWEQGAFGITLGDADTETMPLEPPAPDGWADANAFGVDAGDADAHDADASLPAGEPDDGPASLDAFAPIFDPSSLVDVGDIEVLAAPDEQLVPSFTSHADAIGVTVGDYAFALSDGASDDVDAASSFEPPSYPAMPLPPPEPRLIAHEPSLSRAS